MGLQNVISTVLSTGVPKHTERYKDLFCRSQIDDEVIIKVLPVSIVKEIFDMMLGVGRVIVPREKHSKGGDKGKKGKTAKGKGTKGKGKGKKVVESESEGEEEDNDGFGKFALSTLSSCTACISQYGTMVISETDLIRIRDVLLSNPEKYKYDLEEEDYDKLLAVCQAIVGPGEAPAVMPSDPAKSAKGVRGKKAVEEEEEEDDSDNWEEIDDDGEDSEEEEANVPAKRKRAVAATAAKSKSSHSATRGNSAGSAKGKGKAQDKAVPTKTTKTK